jgi:hypothetical protein
MLDLFDIYYLHGFFKWTLTTTESMLVKDKMKFVR